MAMLESRGESHEWLARQLNVSVARVSALLAFGMPSKEEDERIVTLIREAAG